MASCHALSKKTEIKLEIIIEILLKKPKQNFEV
jgi:hypothetical protein